MLAVVTQREEKSWQVECTVTVSPSPHILVRASLVNCVLELQFWCPKHAFREEACYSSTSRKPNPNVDCVISLVSRFPANSACYFMAIHVCKASHKF